MPFRVIKHRTRKAYKGTRRRRGGGHRSVSPARARSRSRSRSRSPARSRSASPVRSPDMPNLCPPIDPDDVALFKGGNETYAFTMEGRGDGKIGLVHFPTACVIGSLKEAFHNDQYVSNLENGDQIFVRDHWDIDAAGLRASKKQKNSIKSWRKRSNKFHRN